LENNDVSRTNNNSFVGSGTKKVDLLRAQGFDDPVDESSTGMKR
jgi:hypothetical protein